MCVLCQAVYTASFSEDITTNKGILTVGATDADSGSSAEIQYSLFGIGVEDFYMDANTGKLSWYQIYNYLTPLLHYKHLCLPVQVSCAQLLSWTEKLQPPTSSLLRQQMEAGFSAALTFH